MERIRRAKDECASDDNVTANTELMHLSEDFIYASRTVGKIIISEVCFVYFILFHFISFYFILFHFISFYFILFHFISFYFIFFHLFHLI